LKTERGQEPLFKQIFLPCVPEYDKTKKEIISTAAGKSVDMTDINPGHNIVNQNLTLWEEPPDTLK